jgi:hypothetical protein
MSNKLKYSWKSYWEPTPKNIRKMADAIVAACAFSGGLASFNGEPKIGTVIFIVGFVAKILSNFFSEEPNKKEPNEIQ